MSDLSTLNEAQRSAVCAEDRPLLIIAGAGSGKTRTIVHRLAHLHDRGVTPQSMLLLTFTRKAAQEMLHRASSLLDADLFGIQGGTFHAFAYNILRRNPPSWAKNTLSILDTSDCASIISHCKDAKKIGKGDRSFPKNQKILGLFSKSRNKEMSLEETIRRESQHLLGHLEALQELESMYFTYRREHFVVDYDDLLFELESTLRENAVLLEHMHDRLSHIMVDEYQDTNKVQARLVRLLTGARTSVMAVGDDAQSIYAFRGAAVQNILEFPKLFENTQIIRLEENYRSVQPILHVANAILENAPSGFQKNLFSKREFDDTPCVQVYRPMSDISQARLVSKRINELLVEVNPQEIAVLFRAGYQSYHLEVELNKSGISFKKFGGVRYTEAAHIKDVLAFARLVINPLDLPAFERIASLSKGIGPKTAHKLFSIAVKGNGDELKKACARFDDFWQDLNLLMHIQKEQAKPEGILRTIIEHYQPRMEWLYPDDWPRRQQGLDELIGIAAAYEDLALLMADLSLENPPEEGEEEDRRITLSTVHSAKGLEWKHVLILDLVEDRFPSKHALTRPEDYEEERRLLYVACTRAKDTLGLFVPQNLYQRGQGYEERATPSPFIREISPSLYEEVFEQYGGVLIRSSQKNGQSSGSYSRDSYSFGTKVQAKVQTQVWAQTQAQPIDGKSIDAKSIEAKPFRSDFGDDLNDDCQIPEQERAKSFAASHGENNHRENVNHGMHEPQAASRQNTLSGALASTQAGMSPNAKQNTTGKAKTLGFCTHRMFGRGKIVEEIDADKIRVNFSGFGLKVIMKSYVQLED